MELPESYMLSKQISKDISGKIIREVQVLKTPHKFAFFKNDTVIITKTSLQRAISSQNSQ